MSLSIIIPAFNEEERIASTIQTVKARATETENLQIIVADGGSSDRTVTEAQETGARIIRTSQKRRSVQMNEGAGSADHPVLYFLHADTHPPLHFDRIIARTLSAGHHAGCFRLRFDSSHPLLRFYGWCTRFDIDPFRFGDQSLFVYRTVFEKAGGYRDDHLLLEGHEIVKRLKKNHSFEVCDESVLTSARKYDANGALRLQCIYSMIFLLYSIGIEQPQLHNFYQKWVQ